MEAVLATAFNGPDGQDFPPVSRAKAQMNPLVGPRFSVLVNQLIKFNLGFSDFFTYAIRGSILFANEIDRQTLHVL